MQLPLSKTNSCQPEEKHITYVHIHTSIRLYTYIIYVSKPVCINISSHIFSLSYSLSLSICFSLCVVAYVCVCVCVLMYIFTKQPTITKHTALPHGQILWNSVYA